MVLFPSAARRDESRRRRGLDGAAVCRPRDIPVTVSVRVLGETLIQLVQSSPETEVHFLVEIGREVEAGARRVVMVGVDSHWGIIGVG